MAPFSTVPSTWRGLPALGAAAVLALLLVGCTATEQEDTTATASPSVVESGTEAPAAPQIAGTADIPQIVANVQPSVVTVFTQGGSGSGVIYTEDGLILTNEHVVRGAQQVQIAFADGQRVDGTVVAVDVVTDLALVQADRTGLPPAQFETSLPRVGELAVVIGSPLGFENSATAGIISGLHRDIPGSATNSQSLVDLIQTDAAISPGNSGGAVVNSAGRVVGISEAYIPPQAGAVSLGFAIPAATAVEVAEQLREDGTAEHAFVGLGPAAITPQIADRLGLDSTEGALVINVVDGGPADEAGIRPGDVLVRLGDEQLRSPEDLLAALRNYSPGDTVPVEVRRGDETAEVELTLVDRPR
jgi:serine protease DegQ